MNNLNTFNIFAANYKGQFVSHVKAVSDNSDGVRICVEMSRPQMLYALGLGVVLTTAAGSDDEHHPWGRISLIKIHETEYLTLNDQNPGLDDLGDLPVY